MFLGKVLGGGDVPLESGTLLHYPDRASILTTLERFLIYSAGQPTTLIKGDDLEVIESMLPGKDFKYIEKNDNRLEEMATIPDFKEKLEARREGLAMLIRACSSEDS
jgi:hypothetical protein